MLTGVQTVMDGGCGLARHLPVSHTTFSIPSELLTSSTAKCVQTEAFSKVKLVNAETNGYGP